jgi:putative inorganic carbon (HCO3(-)) transporter
MSSRAAVGTTLKRGALGTLPVAAAACAATASMLLARRVPAVLLAPAAVAGCVVVAMRIDPIRALLPIAFIRAGLQGLQSQIIIRTFGIQVSPPDLLTIAVLVGCVWWLVARARSGAPVWKAPTFVPAVLLLAIASTSLLYSPAPALGARDLVKFAAAYAIYLVVVTERPSAEWLKRLLAVVVFGALIPIVVGWWQFTNSIGLGGARESGLRILSTFDHPNTYGFYLVAIVAAAWGLRWAVSPRLRPIVDAIGIAALASTVLTLSRNTWGALAVLVIVIGWRDRRVLLVAAAAAGVAMVAMPRLVIRATDFLNPRMGNNPGGSLVGRLDLWDRDIALWQTQPLIGHGWGSVIDVVNEAAHNDFLRSLAEAGIIGFVFYVLMVGSLIRMGIRSGASRGDLPRAFLGLSIAFALVSLASNNLGKGAFQFYFWLIAGVAYVWSQTVPDARPEPKAEALAEAPS